MKYALATIVAAATVVNAAKVNTYPDCVTGPLAKIAVCDRSKTPPQRAAALVAAMTNDEKLVNIIRYAGCLSKTDFYIDG
jgi:beta-D-xylosidase 4